VTRNAAPTDLMTSDPSLPEKKRAPTLYVIIAIKLIKGTAFATLAFVVYALSDNNLPTEYQHLLHFLRINPEKRFWTQLAVQVGHLTEARVIWVAIGTLIYSLFSLVEGIGLIFRVSWAGWLAIGESAFFIPIELFERVNHPSWMVASILALNIFMVWYLYANRDRLFRHHHH
jgi:uncharacterized membrane protein (DUF2068 family)